MRGRWGTLSGRFEPLILTGRPVEGGQDYGQQESQPFEQASEVVAGGGENGVGGVALGSGEVVSAHAVLGRKRSLDRTYRGVVRGR